MFKEAIFRTLGYSAKINKVLKIFGILNVGRNMTMPTSHHQQRVNILLGGGDGEVLLDFGEKGAFDNNSRERTRRMDEKVWINNKEGAKGGGIEGLNLDFS